ncbi:TIGR04282 family arsenosugar biosynthesis glycosyltransferase [Corallibacter vietnamensis]|uniref:TIGR04282 family arsenosugar biosynthesis glycosyltransferase n=1 Tax=Corallibacter vietnamensis TaxID=904130 RepID=A0ABP7GTJ6_9FLAO
MGLLSSKDTKNNDELAYNFHFPTSKSALIIFTKNPELGKCKTRLAKTIGNEAALHVYTLLLKHTAKITTPIKTDKFVFYSNKILHNDFWDENIFKKRLQQGHNLGERMENAFLELFQSGYEKIIIIGSDLYDLTSEVINVAFETLNNHDHVIGPATDGGYYLLGMKSPHPTIFKNKQWSTASIYKDTLNDLKQNTVYILKKLNDIDTFEDLKAHNKLINAIPRNYDKTY